MVAADLFFKRFMLERKEEECVEVCAPLETEGRQKDDKPVYIEVMEGSESSHSLLTPSESVN